MTFPNLSDAFRISRLQPPQTTLRMVLDTDTYNEIDDQFALTYALLSPDKLSVEAVYAAPFHNTRSSGPADGMEKSYDEILRLLDFLGRAADGFAFRGSTDWVGESRQPQDNAAVRDLIDKALNSPDDDPLYVVAIGAITNVASALLLAPEIIEKIVIVWLGGHHLHWSHTREFNLQQDVAAAQIVLDSGAPFVLVPCYGVTSHLLTTHSELRAHIGGGQRHRRLSLPNLRRLSPRRLRRQQRHLGHFHHRLAHQWRLGAEQSGPQSRADGQCHLERRPLAASRPHRQFRPARSHLPRPLPKNPRAVIL